MKRLFVIATALALAACDQHTAITEMAKCNRELGSADAHLATAQAAQAAAERKAQALEEELRQAREQLATMRGAAGTAGTAVAAAPVPAAAAEDAIAPTPLPLPPAAVPEKGGKRLKVGVSLPVREERWIKDKLTMLAEAKKRNIDLQVQISESIDPAKQAAQCDAMIASGIKVLIIAPSDASAAAAIVEKAVRAGVQVISYDRLVLDSPHDYYYLSFDNVKVGELQGSWLTKWVSKGNYVVLSGAPTDNNAKLFKQGAMKFIQPLVDKGDVKIVYEQACKDWAPTEATKHCEAALAQTTDIQGILAPNDGTSGGCTEALAARGLAGKIPITGQDGDLAAAIRIAKGEQGMTVFKDTRLLGKAALEMAEALGRGKPYDTAGRTISNNKRQVRAVLLTPALVTKDNLDETLIKSGYLSRAAVYRK